MNIAILKNEKNYLILNSSYKIHIDHLKTKETKLKICRLYSNARC